MPLRAVASMRQDEAIASSWFWPKIDFSEEKYHGKCFKEHFWAFRFQHFLGGYAPRPPNGLHLRCLKLVSSFSEVWLRPYLWQRKHVLWMLESAPNKMNLRRGFVLCSKIENRANIEMLKRQLLHQRILWPIFMAYCGLADINQRLFIC